MALWTGLGQAATVAQLAGVDAGGLITMIIQAVQTVRRNRENCQQLARRAMMIGDLLQQLQDSEMMQRPEIRRPLDGLDDTLRHAYMLVMSCQDSNLMYRFFMGANQANQFREVESKIDSYLLLYPLISHIDITRRLVLLSNNAQPPSSQAAEEVLQSSTDHSSPNNSHGMDEATVEEQESFTSHSNPETRTEESSLENSELERTQEVTEPFAAEEQHQTGHQDIVETSNRRHKFRWHGWWAQRVTKEASFIARFIGQEAPGLSVFSFSEMVAATNNFSSRHEIGCGGFGPVYKGRLCDGLEVAVKRHQKRQPADPMFPSTDFENEIQLIPKLQHTNIIKLLGCCVKGEEKILVYEYMPNGSLKDIIDPIRAMSLGWSSRYRIIEGIAQGVFYLHKHSRVCIVHADLKPGNILLDSDMNPKITDFGIAKVLSPSEDEELVDSISGTIGYIAPELMINSIYSTKSDVYAFGVMLLEIISTKRSVFELHDEGHIYLADYAWDLWSTGSALELIDPSLRDEHKIDEILRCIPMALLCVQENPADRPTMWDILLMLSSDSISLPSPNQPPGYSQRRAYLSEEWTSYDGHTNLDAGEDVTELTLPR